MIERRDLAVGGMHCAACAGTIEEALRKVAGVKEASVNIATRRATVRFDPTLATPEDLIGAIRGAGYEGSEAPEPSSAATHSEPRIERWRLWVAVALTAPVAIIAMAHGRLPWPDHATGAWIQLTLSAPVVFWCGAPFFRGAWAAFKRRRADMNTLVAVGVATAYLTSAASMIAPGLFVASPGGAAPPIYFESAAVIVTLILVGRTLGARARHRAGGAIRALLELAPERARVVRDGAEVEVLSRDLAAGDLIAVRPGERIPTDGVVVDGACRDVDGSQAVGFPVYARAVVPLTARGRIVEESYNQPVQCGGVPVYPGDYLIGDGSGVVFVPQDRLDEVLAVAEELAAREQEMLAEIRKGADILQVDQQHGYERMLQRES